MGKSLTILALVMKTLDDALTWTSSTDQRHEKLDYTAALMRCRATLVLVPSACKKLNDLFLRSYKGSC
jgi:hypothetical protein